MLIQPRKEDRNVVSECANPRCHEPFVYFRQGKIFAVPRGLNEVTRATIEYFWLCQRCAESMALEFRQGDSHPSLVSRRAS
jgi:hypothetical protein